MKPALEEVIKVCPDVNPTLVRAHWERLDERYFQRFTLETVAEHVRGLARLSRENPAEVLFEFQEHQKIGCTILAYDCQSLFALLAGILAGLGFNILSGGVHTYQASPPEAGPESTFRFPGPKVRRIRPRPAEETLPGKRRLIVDHFSGLLRPGLSPDLWMSRTRQEIRDVLGRLERGGQQGKIQANQRVNELVAQCLAILPPEPKKAWQFPLSMELDSSGGMYTRLKIVSQDTPAFLYALANALAGQGVSIEHVRIQTFHHRVEDVLDFVDARGNPITDPKMLDQIKLSVLLTKQFTLFLGQAPDPFAALSRFEQLVQNVIRLPETGQWVELLSNPRLLQDLARLLGTSDFLWEDLIRQQYETILPMLLPATGAVFRPFAIPVALLPERLEEMVAGAPTFEEKKARLNAFKDQEIFRIDLDHILQGGEDFRSLSEHLTFLGEQVIQQAVKICGAQLAERFGRPRTVAGLEAGLAILGLGKFGGAALGYASDIELMFIFSDAGRTDGPEPITNQEFFERLVKEVLGAVWAKREGIFQLDLRLRPHGADGPLANSLESFCRYYGKGGAAHALERLALVRMRAVGGDRELGAQLERLRDEFIYATRSLSVEDLREMRRKQFREKTQGGRLNAKFSPGALVDLEYDVQLLQIFYGRENDSLRSPRIHLALENLGRAGILAEEEAAGLARAYAFLRRLINGLRILRGSAQDLFLPPQESDEYLHLARRLGYQPREGLDPARQLHWEFETQTAAVRVFVEKHFGREALPGPENGNAADLVLSSQLSPEERRRILGEYGFRDPDRANANWKSLAGMGAASRSGFARLAVLACDVLRRQSDPDRALNNWEQFARALPDPEKHFEELLAQPKRLEIIMTLFAASQFLAEVLIRNPNFYGWVTDPLHLTRARRREEYADELQGWIRAAPDDWLDLLRRYRRRETLRIGTRDLCLRADLLETTSELSHLADALIQTALQQVVEQGPLPQDVSAKWLDRFCILAFGKLGGRELNYSSDIDLLGIWEDAPPRPEDEPPIARWLEKLGQALSLHTAAGYVYRVDLRLRPYGGEGELVATLSSMLEYYQTKASLGELQALLKVRPVAGNLAVGETFLRAVRPYFQARLDSAAIVREIESNRRKALRRLREKSPKMLDVKTSLGGLRDIEFLVQALQWIHGPTHPGLWGTNTLQTLAVLSRLKLVPAEAARSLSEDYIWLRRLEHFLQLLEDLQVHALPDNMEGLTILARQMGGGAAVTGERFLEEVRAHLHRVRLVYETHFLEKYLPGFTGEKSSVKP